jgi:hypothetical protein
VASCDDARSVHADHGALGRPNADQAEAAWRALGVGAEPAAVDRLALLTLGTRPTNTFGQPLTLAPEGMRDPNGGSAYAPLVPAVPPPGTSLGGLWKRASGFRSEVAIDDEPAPARSKPARPSEDGEPGGALESLHVRLRLELAPAKK